METSLDLGALGQLSVFPDETAKSLFRRKAGRPIDLGIPALSALPRPGRSAHGVFPGDVVEVYGESGSGKTEVLLHAVAHVLLPPQPSAPPRIVVYFDHECRLDLARLKLLLRHRLDTLAESQHGAEARPRAYGVRRGLRWKGGGLCCTQKVYCCFVTTLNCPGASSHLGVAVRSGCRRMNAAAAALG